MENIDRVNLIATLTRTSRENLYHCVPNHAETVFTLLVKQQPNRGRDYTKWLIDLMNYWSYILNVTFGLRYDCKSFADYLKR